MYYTETLYLSNITVTIFKLYGNYNNEFVNKETTCHTNAIEGLSGNIKIRICKKKGMKFTVETNFIDFKIFVSRKISNYTCL